MDKQIVALMIPLLTIGMGIGLAMMGVWFDYRRKREMFELYHKERMAAIEKGLDVPPLAADFLQSRRRRLTLPELLRRGLILLFVGVALVVAMSYDTHEIVWWGLLPAAIGLAYLISYLVERKRFPAQGDGAEPGPTP